MTPLARGRISDTELKEIIRQANALKLPGVVKINCTFGEDWAGDPALFFWVTLTDRACRNVRLLGDTADAVREAIRKGMDPRNTYDVMPYFSFRSESEQKELRDKTYG